MQRAQSVDSSKPSLPSKLLHRFYEPLGLLYALGKARGKRTPKTLPSSEQVDSLTAQELRREFLDELAFLCDHKKGGDTVTAIGLGQTPQGCVFWVAANKCPQGLIVPFLEELLIILKESHGKRDGQLFKDIFRISVTFAHAKIKTYAKFLLSDLDKLKEFPACADAAISGFITDWEKKLDNLVKEDLHSLVDFAYKNRHSDFMHQLATLAHERQHKISRDSLQAICTSVRHNIGRLGFHARSATCLALYTPRMMAVLDFYSVQAVSVPITGNGRPQPRKSTTVEATLIRMLPKDAPRLEEYQQALADMDELHKISERFLEGYKCKTRVHAEVQVLHHFDQHDEEFAEGDKYIACSKPACFCCHLYFRHHPGGFVEPRSHHKIYLNWQPPGFFSGVNPRNETQLRKILDSMIRDIRKDALRQITEKAPPRSVHPDSVTGISISVLAAPELDAISTTADDEEAVDELDNFGSDHSSFESDHAVASSSSVVLPSVDSDTDDEEGGVSLLGIL